MSPDYQAPTPNAHYAISRLQSKGGFWYWMVAFRRRGKHYYKSFYDVRRGGPEKSLADAIAWRDAQLQKAQALGMRDFRRIVRGNNRSGVPGVAFVRRPNQPEGFWMARLKQPDGRELTQCFGIRKYGEREAFRRAVEARKELLERVEDKAFVHHPKAKAVCAEQAAKASPAKKQNKNSGAA